MRGWRIDAARRRQAAAGSSSVPNTTISPGASPPARRVTYAVNPASPLPTIAQRSTSGRLPGRDLAQRQSEVEQERVRPEQRRGRRAPPRHPVLVPVRPEEVSRDLLGESAVGRGLRGDPFELRVRFVLAPGLEVLQAEKGGEKKPLPAAVVLIVQVALDAALVDELGLNGRDRPSHDGVIGREQAERRCDGDQARIHAILVPGRAQAACAVRTHSLLDPRLTGAYTKDLGAAKTRSDGGERHRMDALALLPPVVAGLLPERRDVPGRQAGRPGERVGVAPVALDVPGERPDPRAPAVQLVVGPVEVGLAAVERVAGP